MKLHPSNMKRFRVWYTLENVVKNPHFANPVVRYYNYILAIQRVNVCAGLWGCLKSLFLNIYVFSTSTVSPQKTGRPVAANNLWGICRPEPDCWKNAKLTFCAALSPSHFPAMRCRVFLQRSLRNCCSPGC